MPEILTEQAPAEIPDLEFLRRAGIAPSLTPRLSMGRKLLLALALLLAGSTGVFAGLFQAGSPAASDSFTDCATQCPMGDAPAKPAPPAK
jgi:hypothetical protein